MSRAGTRLAWDAVPAAVRLAVEAALGSPVVRHDNVVGGFTPGPAGPLELADGRRLFAKACGDDISPAATAMHRRELETLPVLGDAAPAPDLILGLEVDGWVVLVTELIPGASPTTPLTTDATTAVLDLLTRIAETTDPGTWGGVLHPVGTDPRERDARWAWPKVEQDGTTDQLPAWPRRHLDRLAELEHSWIEAAAGPHLLHRDLRIDNVVINGDRAIAVDWADASLGAAWVDLVGLLPSFEMDGAPPPEELFEAHPIGAAADPDAVNVYLAALAGYFVRSSLLPPPPLVRGLRDFQAAQGLIACRWLASRLGW